MKCLFVTRENLAASQEGDGGISSSNKPEVAAGTNEDKSGQNKGSPTPSCQGKTDERQKIKDRRRKTEDKMAMIFIAIVSCFLVTNFLRIFLNFHEVITINQANMCTKLGKA